MLDSRRLLARPVEQVAPLLLGWRLRSEVGGLVAEIRLIEVEAYGPDDPASHSYHGRTARNSAMFEPPGTLYVYRSYGVHWCANVVTGAVGVGAAVLLRGGSPVAGELVMAERRGRSSHLCDGPGKLAQAMGIDQSLNGIDLLDAGSPVRLLPDPSPSGYSIATRIGISRATDRMLRFGILEGEPEGRR